MHKDKARLCLSCGEIHEIMICPVCAVGPSHPITEWIDKTLNDHLSRMEERKPLKNYEMSEEQLKVVLDACKPTPVMYLSGGVPMGGTPQENANRAWASLGEEMGFDSTTVEPTGKGPRFFSAEPVEKEEKEDGSI